MVKALFALAKYLKWHYNQIFTLDFLGVSHTITWQNKSTAYHLQISALVLEILKFEKCVKYVNEMMKKYLLFATMQN